MSQSLNLLPPNPHPPLLGQRTARSQFALAQDINAFCEDYVKRNLMLGIDLDNSNDWSDEEWARYWHFKDYTSALIRAITGLLDFMPILSCPYDCNLALTPQVSGSTHGPNCANQTHYPVGLELLLGGANNFVDILDQFTTNWLETYTRDVWVSSGDHLAWRAVANEVELRRNYSFSPGEAVASELELRRMYPVSPDASIPPDSDESTSSSREIAMDVDPSSESEDAKSPEREVLPPFEDADDSTPPSSSSNSQKDTK